MLCTNWDFVQVITCGAELCKLKLIQYYSSLMFGNMFLLLTLEITVGFNISILFQETVVM